MKLLLLDFIEFITIDVLSYQVFPTSRALHLKDEADGPGSVTTFGCVKICVVCLFVPTLLEIVWVFVPFNIWVVFICHPWKTHQCTKQNRFLEHRDRHTSDFLVECCWLSGSAFVWCLMLVETKGSRGIIPNQIKMAGSSK